MSGTLRNRHVFALEENAQLIKRRKVWNVSHETYPFKAKILPPALRTSSLTESNFVKINKYCFSFYVFRYVFVMYAWYTLYWKVQIKKVILLQEKKQKWGNLSKVLSFTYFSDAISIFDIIGSTGNSAMRRPSCKERKRQMIIKHHTICFTCMQEMPPWWILCHHMHKKLLRK